jgi:methylthioribose-1-phosphate isomerase
MIDQRRLPLSEEYVCCSKWMEVADAISDMVIRGAPAIGVAAAFGIVLAAKQVLAERPEPAGDIDGFRAYLQDATKGLFATRPTAVNLKWALDQMQEIWGGEGPEWAGGDHVCAKARSEREAELPGEVTARLEARAVQILEEDVASCRRIGEYGAELIMEGLPGERGPVILTHCNAGALATAGYGTALGVVRSVHARTPAMHVLVDETRPFLQGARLTAWELSREGIPFTLICDNMAGYFMSRGEVTHVVVGADRIAANGDTANKIGTYTVSVLAREHGIPFYVAAPLSTVDLSLADGDSIPIEERSPNEVLFLGEARVAPWGAKARNPSFDVTPACSITAIITDAGAARPPYELSLAALTQAAAGRDR